MMITFEVSRILGRFAKLYDGKNSFWAGLRKFMLVKFLMGAKISFG